MREEQACAVGDCCRRSELVAALWQGSVISGDLSACDVHAVLRSLGDCRLEPA